MPEQPHPERRPTESLRPIAEIVAGRETMRRASEVFESDSQKKGATNEWFISVNKEIDLLDMDSNSKRTVKLLAPVVIEIGKTFGWRDGLQYALGKERSASVFNAWMGSHNDSFSMSFSSPGVARHLNEVSNAEGLVTTSLEELEDKESQAIARFMSEEYKKRQELEKSAQEYSSIEEYIDYQLKVGEAKPAPQAFEDFFNPLLITPEAGKFFLKVQGIRSYEGIRARKEALDWVLGEEDENNGLARMLAEQRENPPGSK